MLQPRHLLFALLTVGPLTQSLAAYARGAEAPKPEAAIPRRNSVALPESIAALGDSMSAGVLAAYRREQALLPTHHLRILLDTLQFMTTRNREHFAFRKLAWSTGSHINSHAERLKRLNSSIKIGNFAEPSAYTHDIVTRQLPALERWSLAQTGRRVPDYTTLLVGHNDLCAPSISQTTSPAHYGRDVRQMLEFLLGRGEGRSRVLVLPISRIDKLVELSGQAWMFPVPGFARCKDMWKKIPLCESVTQTANPGERIALRKRIHSYNAALKSEVSRARGRYGDRVRFAGFMSEQLPVPEHLAIDCFHPNKDAQKAIADNAWSQTWWKNLEP